MTTEFQAVDYCGCSCYLVILFVDHHMKSVFSKEYGLHSVVTRPVLDAVTQDMKCHRKL